MQTRLVGFLYRYRHLLRWMIFIRRPVLLKLEHFHIYVRLDDWAVGARIAIKRGYETHVSTLMYDLLSPGNVLVDIGANIGYYTLLAASQVGSTGKVIAFEPDQDNCMLLKMSLQANGFENVELHPYAVFDKKEMVGFDKGVGSSNAVISPIETSRYQVEAVSLDVFLNHESQVDIVKMDIEGAEGRALKGMQQLVRCHRPIIFTEFNPKGLGIRSSISPEAYLDRLYDLGYDLFVLHKEGHKSSEPQSKAQIMHHFEDMGLHHLDLVAYPKE